MGSEHASKDTKDSAKRPEHAQQAGEEQFQEKAPALSSNLSPAHILHLQRTLGNKAVQRLVGQNKSTSKSSEHSGIIQRAGFLGIGDNRTARQKIDDALKSKDPGDAKDINQSEIVEADASERFKLINILAYQGWVGPRDETLIEQIWASFGDKLAEQLNDAGKMELWNHCIAVGAELEDLPQIKKLREQFKEDIKQIVSTYLFDNRQTVMQEMQKFGINGDESAPQTPMNDQQTQQMQQMQEAAQVVSKIQAGQEKLRDIPVGYSKPKDTRDGGVDEDGKTDIWPGEDAFATFDPFRRPPYDRNPDNPKQQPWEQVKDAYDVGTTWISQITDKYPMLYAISREGKSDDTQKFAELSPSQAKAEMGPPLRKLLADIEGTQIKLNGGKLNPLDLTPIHEQLYSGKQGASGILWSDQLPKWVGKYETGKHAMETALEELALSSIAAAAFLVAPFTGGASLLVMTVGLAATAGKAALSAERYEALAQAAKTSVKADSQLVTPEEVNIAGIKANADKFELVVAGLTVGMAAAGEAIAALRASASGAKIVGAGAAEAGENIASQIPQRLESAGAKATGRPQMTDPWGLQGDVMATAKTSRSMNTAIRADMGEAAAYNEALNRGEIGLQRPGGANVAGTDFITAVRDGKGQMGIIVTDVKTSVQGKFPTPKNQMPGSWQTEVQQAVSSGRLQLNDAKLEAEIQQAFQQGRVQLRQINVDYSATGQGNVIGF